MLRRSLGYAAPGIVTLLSDIHLGGDEIDN